MVNIFKARGHNLMQFAIGDFALKRKIGTGSLYLTKNRSGKSLSCCAGDYHSYMSNMRAKEFSDSNFNLKSSY